MMTTKSAALKGLIAVVSATMMYLLACSDVLHTNTRRYAMQSFGASGNGRDDLLFTSHEMRQLLYAEVDSNGKRSSMDSLTVSDWRYASMIRSKMTRPNPSRPVNLTAQKRKHLSEGGQSKLVDKRLGGRRNGFFIECGAHDGQWNTNTLFFEVERNWTGLLIEPNPTTYRKLLNTNRNVYTFSGCISPTGHSEQKTFVAAGIYGGIQDDMPEKFKRVIKNKQIEFTAIPALCFPLVDVLDVIGVHHIDYLSLDIEGPELEVLETIDWQRIRIDIMTVEIHGDEKKLNDSRLLMKRIGGYNEVGLQGLDVVYERSDLKKH